MTQNSSKWIRVYTSWGEKANKRRQMAEGGGLTQKLTTSVLLNHYKK